VGLGRRRKTGLGETGARRGGPVLPRVLLSPKAWLSGHAADLEAVLSASGAKYLAPEASDG
jgi:hypothetical protein